MSTNKKPAKKSAAKKPKTMAPMSADKLARINEQRKTQGLEPLPAEQAGAAPKKGKPAKPAKELAIVREIKPSDTPIQELLKSKVKFRDSGMIEVDKEITAPEAVSLVSFFEDARRSSGMHIGAVIVAAEKNKSATLDEIAKATGLERKTLHNMSSAMRNTSLAAIEGALKKGAKAGNEVTFTHVAAVAGLEPDKKKLLLEKVADEGLTVAALNVEVRKLAPKTAKRAAAEKKKKAKATANADAKQKAAETAAAAETGNATVDSPLGDEDEKRTEAAEEALDTVVTFLRSATFSLLSKKRKAQFLQPMRQVAEFHATLVEELATNG